MREIAPFKVIIAEEILTPMGEIMGLFLSHQVPSGLSIQEAIAQIKAQGGLVCLPHPFGHPYGVGGKQSLETLLPEVDIIEVFNSRAVPLNNSNKKARLLAQRYGLLCSAGSDAHTLREIGHAYVEMPEFNGKEEFRLALAQGKIFGRMSCPLVHIPSTLTRFRKNLLK